MQAALDELRRQRITDFFHLHLPIKMDELNGEIVCVVEKWCKLVAALLSGQRARVADTTLRIMLQIPSIKMRTPLIRYMVENFEASTARFIIQEQVGVVTLGAVDIECIFNLENQGLSASHILIEEGEDIKERVLPEFLIKKGKHLRQWPKGNLALLQYLYWEKAQPVEGDYAYNPNLSIQPLMRNWTKGAATRRDQFDYDNGRGRGNVKIKNNITQEYRAQEPKTPNNAPTMKPKTKPANGNAKKSTTAPISEDLMELLMKQCMDFIHTQMRQIPDQVAERLLEKLNKAGVM
ncbi:hypothetical protein VPH35_088979 [Triticum aestivum]